MKVGDVLETAIWLSGTETPELRAKFEKQCRDSIAEGEAENGVVCGPISFTEKYPGDDRVPPVPNHISGPNVRLLVIETEVIAVHDSSGVPMHFATDLVPKDLERLRQITRRAHQGMNPGKPELTDQQCDEIIDKLGPEVAARQIKKAVDSGTVH